MESTKQKKKTKKEIKVEYEAYLLHQFKYPKSQLCYLYFKGDCINPSCQFAHGVKELRLEDFFRLINDKEVYQLEDRDKWQKTYFYKVQDVRPFESLIEYQNNNKEYFQRFYTQNEIIDNPRKRMEIRRVLNRNTLTGVIKLLLSSMTIVEINKLYKLIEKIGFPFSIKMHLQPGIFFTKVLKVNKKDSSDLNTEEDSKMKKKAKKSLKKCYHCILYPPNDTMMKKFIEIIDQYCRENRDNPNLFTELFPCSFYSISKIINKRLETLDPSPSHYVLKNMITQMKFVDLLCTDLIKSSSIPEIRALKIEEIIYKQKIEETIAEIVETFWTQHFGLHSTQYAFIEYSDFLSESFLSNRYLKEHEKLSENDMKAMILLELHQKGNLFFFDNTTKMYIFNYKQFGSYDIEEFSESYYHKRCGIIDKEINDSSSSFLNKNYEEEGEENKDKEKVNDNQVNITSKIDTLSIVNEAETCLFVNNSETLLKFIERINQGVKEFAVDLEGKLKITQPSINLLQLALNEKEIYVFDIYTFTHSKEEGIVKSLPLLKTVLTAIFESESILKIFFDGRGDLNSLHLVFDICPIHYVDLSSINSALKSFQEQIAFKATSICQGTAKKFDSLVKCCFQNTMKGINVILYEYEKNHQVNPLKEKLHALFDEKEYAYFTSRPINEEFLLYSALDVKFLIETFHNMRSEMKTILKPLYGDVKHIDLVLVLISSGHLAQGCYYANRKVNKKEEETTVKTD